MNYYQIIDITSLNFEKKIKMYNLNLFSNISFADRSKHLPNELCNYSISYQRAYYDQYRNIATCKIFTKVIIVAND